MLDRKAVLISAVAACTDSGLGTRHCRSNRMPGICSCHLVIRMAVVCQVGCHQSVKMRQIAVVLSQ